MCVEELITDDNNNNDNNDRQFMIAYVLWHSANEPNINELYHLLRILLQNMCQQQKCPSNAKNMAYAPIKYSMYIYGASKPIYMPHMKLLPLMM